MFQLRLYISEHVILQWFFFIFGMKSKLLSPVHKALHEATGISWGAHRSPGSLRPLGFTSVLLWTVLAPSFLSRLECGPQALSLVSPSWFLTWDVSPLCSQSLSLPPHWPFHLQNFLFSPPIDSEAFEDRNNVFYNFILGIQRDIWHLIGAVKSNGKGRLQMEYLFWWS